MFTLTTRCSPPEWALLERRLLDDMSAAAALFVERYTRPDGTLFWRDEWPGMDGSDDAYESFFNFPLLSALGGSLDVDALARREWEAVTGQFTEYGQIYREFDAYYDWMHHGESSLLFYYFGLTHPNDSSMSDRARRFVEMYTGDDPEAENYDSALRMMRSPITGSRGPRFVNSAEDWVTHRPILANYPPPFDDVPGIAPGAAKADWNDDTTFAAILKLMNERMMRGDVPLNLTATSLGAHAFMLTGDERFRAWALDYTSAWQARAAENGGIIPDNVGPAGIVGELMGGRWWGGYYGWRWPHGFMNQIQSCTIAAANSQLLSGTSDALDLPRTLLDRMEELGEAHEGEYRIPHRHGDDGWYDFRSVDPYYPIHLWYLSMREDDRERIDRWWGAGDPVAVHDGRGKGDDTHTAQWYAFVSGKNPPYPEQILRANHREMTRRLAAIREDNGDPTEWDVHHWQDLNPVVCEGLVQLMMGGPNAIYHGGLLHTRLRYFDPEMGRAGLPKDVAACVTAIDSEDVTVELVNLDPFRSRRLVVQAGAFGEHRFGVVRHGDAEERVESTHFEVELGPSAGGELRIGMSLYAQAPSYRQPLPGVCT